jgi:hypothetical protein
MRLRWSKMTAFLGFVSKDFGELGSLFERSEFEQVPKVCEQNRKECSFCDRSTQRETSPIEFGQAPSACLRPPFRPVSKVNVIRNPESSCQYCLTVSQCIANDCGS